MLVLLSLALITVYFRESAGGPLHRTQGVGAAVLRPFEVGAERIARPFRDVYDYFHGLAVARSENERLKSELERYRQLYDQNATAVHDNLLLTKILKYEQGPHFPTGFRAVNTRVIAQPPSQFEQQIVVEAGSNQGIRRYDPVVTPAGLVGDVTKVFSNVARVTLLTDEQSAVGAMNLKGASGLVRHGASPGSTLILDQVTKDQIVQRGDHVLTQGTLAGKLPSVYPRGIPIGVVTHVGQSDVGLYKDIQLRPFVDFSSLESVIVLVPKVRAGQLP
ncbi:MAG TPA: rod shape-determining protein MreC [Gaiellaceae bacterium]|nr:rod shape-determining protein MreC [Gaiellaceae bacterium]